MNSCTCSGICWKQSLGHGSVRGYPGLNSITQKGNIKNKIHFGIFTLQPPDVVRWCTSAQFLHRKNSNSWSFWWHLRHSKKCSDSKSVNSIFRFCTIFEGFSKMWPIMWRKPRSVQSCATTGPTQVLHTNIQTHLQTTFSHFKVFKVAGNVC